MMMFARILVCSALISLVAGCAKKPKITGKSGDSPSGEKTLSAEDRAKLIAKDKCPDRGQQAAEKPNWLNDPRFKKEKDEAKGSFPIGDPGNEPPSDGHGKPGWGEGRPPGLVIPQGPPMPRSGPGAPPTGGPGLGLPGAGPGFPAPPATPGQPVGTPAQPGGKTVSKADMNEVWTFIENASGASGKMPAPDLVSAALCQAKSHAADLVKSGYIVLTGAKTRESLWAFEKNAPAQGGWIATQNGPEQVTAAEFAKRFGR